MPVAGNDWMKLYTSLLEHDGFAGLDDAARMLIVSLWMYAARSGLYVLPADPKWIWRKIPMLNSEPDIEPLITTQDAYGNPTPFLAYCQPPGQVDTDRSGAEQPAKKVTKKKKRRPGTTVATRTRGAQRDRKRVESREKRREKIEDVTLAGYGREKEREKKERVNSAVRKERGRTEKTETEALEPEKSESPIDSEAGLAKALHIVPKPAHSVTRRIGPQRIGAVVGEWIPAHWLDPDCETFGWEIVRALGYPDDRQDAKARSEWGSFAAWWSKVKAAAPVLVIDELRATAIRKADYLRTKGRSAKNKSKVWFYIMNGELHHRGVPNDRQARASPAQ